MTDRSTEIRALAAVARECGITRLRVGDLEFEVGVAPSVPADDDPTHAERYRSRRDEILFASGAGTRVRLPVG